MHPKHLSIKDFDYTLPDEKIAAFPLPKRDESKLLIYKNGLIKEGVFKNITDYLPDNSFLVFNNSRVIKARILFKKNSGGIIEIFLLEPYESVNNYNNVFQKKKSVQWKCMIGGAGKWKEKFLEKIIIINNEQLIIKAELIKKLPDAYIAELSWNIDEYSFSEIMMHAGEIPLPPYIKRNAAANDEETYQTIYAKDEGSVAAPTAGLHFTERIFSSLKKKKIDSGFVTLHVGAGTFKPVKSAIMEEHVMHEEWMDISVEFIQQLINHIDRTIFCVGTTSLRTVESLYWMGFKTLQKKDIDINELEIQQWEVYEYLLIAPSVTIMEALQSLLGYLSGKKLSHLFIKTQIIIMPGYQFKITDGLITNFHQPKSTLLLLVAAMVGDTWKSMYNYALENNFRFLSYGDGCLIFKNESSITR